jgi:hypothetical protein
MPTVPTTSKPSLTNRPARQPNKGSRASMANWRAILCGTLQVANEQGSLIPTCVSACG